MDKEIGAFNGSSLYALVIVYMYDKKKIMPVFTTKTIVPVKHIMYDWVKIPEMKLVSTVGVGVGVGVQD